MARNKYDKETAAKKAELSNMVGHYQEGFAVGNREGLEWAFMAATTIAGKARTTQGQNALVAVAELIAAEIRRKFPGRKEQ